MAKLDLYNQEWLDMLFEGRNKSYGAYELRAKSPKILTTSFFIGAIVFAFAIATIFFLKGSEKKDVGQNAILVDMADVNIPDIPEIPEDIPPPPPPEEAVKNINDEVKFTEPEVVEAKKVTEDPPTVTDLEKADPGQKTQEGDKEKGEQKILEDTGDKDKDDNADANQIYVAVEKQAGPPGGMPGFYKSFATKFNAPEVDSNVRQIKVFLQFVVEKDGSFTDIKVVRDPGYGAGREAVRVLKSMPKWTPAEQNGRKVRSQFTLPITINVQ